MSDDGKIRVHWTVTLWGPRAADNPEHSVAGSGATPDEAAIALRNNLHDKADLIESFGRKAVRLP